MNEDHGQELMVLISKDSSVTGFVPGHTHGSVDYTSVDYGHVHQCLDVTSPAIPTQDGSHIQSTEGYVMFENGHVHYYDFYTTTDQGHRHRIQGVDMSAPGTN
jgi:hypothetical protein